MKGIYILYIKLKKDSKIKIGSLNSIYFKKGFYAYVGSAQNSLEKRISRHKSKNKKFHWHIDYFLNNKNAKIDSVEFKELPKSFECKIAKKILKNSDPVLNFGCSDCKCKSHFFRINK